MALTHHTAAMRMGIALQLLFTGLGVGSIYALVALGFVLIYRATNVVNFAQGDFAMLAAFSMVVLCIDLQLPYWLAILITLTAMLVFGALFNFAVYAASIIGGFGDVTGAIVGGLGLGVVETFGAAYISVPYKDAFAFIVLVVFLLFRPQGLFGEKVAEKA